MKTTVLMATSGQSDWDQHLHSVMDQSVPADQVIVVFDRPTDDQQRASIIESWPDILFLFNGMNEGLTKSLNRGLQAATGDYIFRADDDDIYRRDRIEKQLDYIKKTGADFVASWAAGKGEISDSKQYLITCPTDDPNIKRKLLKRNILIHPSLAVRREALVALGGYDETYAYAQDYALYLSGIRYGYSFAAVPEPLLQRKYSGDSISSAKRHQQLMYSCAAKAAHHAAQNERTAFVKTLAFYIVLAIIPRSMRRWRRAVFSFIGRGA